MATIDGHGNIHRGRGIPLAGAFAGHVRTGPAGSLGEEERADIRRMLARRAQLEKDGYVAAVASYSEGTSARSAENIEGWYAQARRNAGVNTGYELMPEDWAPAGAHTSTGHSLAGRRRIDRIKYEGGGLAVRMYRASTIKQFAKAHGGTFEFPIEIEGTAGRSMIGHVRVTQNAPGKWTVEPLGFPANVSWRASEAVASVLEARRPSHALRDAGDLLAKHRERIASAGTILQENESGSTFVKAMGYNRASQEMTIQLGERTYGYHVDEEIYEAVQQASSVGARYNELVKNHAERVPVDQCGSCKRWFNADRGHQCRAHAKPVAGRVTPYEALVQVHVAAEAGAASFADITNARELYSASLAAA
ncbi:KTSC domain-containing protein [Microbacterium xylanilyticum]